MNWTNLGEAKPPTGTEIYNERLAKELASRTAFRRADLDTFNVRRLQADSFIKVGEAYFAPDDPMLGLSWMPCNPPWRPPKRKTPAFIRGDVKGLARALRRRLEFTLSSDSKCGILQYKIRGLRPDGYVTVEIAEGVLRYFQPSDQGTRERRQLVAARHLQTCFRVRQMMISRFGPELFLRSDGEPAAFGKLLFRSMRTPPRLFLVISSRSCSMTMLASFMRKYWHIPHPEVVISITGSSKDFDYTSAQDWLPAFRVGLDRAASATSAWLISTGLDHGIFKIVGEMKSERPLVGVLPVGSVYGTEDLLSSRGTMPITYKGRAHHAGAEAAGRNPHLNGGHTHFILFDDGLMPVERQRRSFVSKGHKNALMEARSDLETEIAKSNGAPRVQLVVQGGLSTLSFVRLTANAYDPIVLIVESGGAARAIFEYVQNGDSSYGEKLAPDASAHVHEQVRMDLEEIKRLHVETDSKLLTFVEQLDLEGLDAAMMAAILQMHNHKKNNKNKRRAQDNRARLLKLAISWNRSDIVKDQLKLNYEDALDSRSSSSSLHLMKFDNRSCSTARKCCRFERSWLHSHDRLPMIVAQGLELAFELRRTTIVEDLLDEYSAAGSLTDVESICKFVSIVQLYKATLDGHGPDEHQIFESEKLNHLKNFLIEHSKDISQLKGCAQAQTEMYRNVILPFLRQFSWMLANFVQKIEHFDIDHGHYSQCISPIDIFFWAVLMGADDLVEVMWYHCKRPVVAALLGALLCKRVGSTLHHGHARSRMMERAKRLEQWAADLLEFATNEEADQIISLKLVQDEQYTLLDLALHSEHKTFLAHRHCDRHMDMIWRGEDVLVAGKTGTCTLRKGIWYTGLALKAAALPFVVLIQTITRPCKHVSRVRNAQGARSKAEITFELAFEKVKVVKRRAEEEVLGQKAEARRICKDILENLIDEASTEDRLDEDYSQFSCNIESVAVATAALSRQATNRKGCCFESPMESVKSRRKNRSLGTAGLSAPTRDPDLEHAYKREHTRMHSTDEPKRPVAVAVPKRPIQLSVPGVPIIRSSSSGDIDVLKETLRGKTRRASLEEVVAEFSEEVDYRIATPVRQLIGFYQIPMVRLYHRALMHFCWLGVYVAVIVSNSVVRAGDIMGQQGVWSQSSLSFTWVIFHVGHFMDQRHLIMMQTHHHIDDRDPTKYMWYFVDVLFVVTICLRIPFDLVQDEALAVKLYNAYEITLSLNVLVVCLLSLPYFSEWKTFGVLLIMVEEMLMDVLKWMLLQAIVLLAFSLCLLGFERAGWYTYEDDEPSDTHPILRPDGAFWAPFWVMFGDVQPSSYGSMLESGTGWLIWTYSMVASVILVNLLVAMMADTYARVSESAQSMYIHQRYNRIFAYRHLHTTVPPPFNLPWVVFDVLTIMTKCRRPHCEPVPSQDNFTDGSALLHAYKGAKLAETEGQMDEKFLQLQRELRTVKEESEAHMDRKISKLEKELHEQNKRNDAWQKKIQLLIKGALKTNEPVRKI